MRGGCEWGVNTERVITVIRTRWALFGESSWWISKFCEMVGNSFHDGIMSYFAAFNCNGDVLLVSCFLSMVDELIHEVGVY